MQEPAQDSLPGVILVGDGQFGDLLRIFGGLTNSAVLPLSRPVEEILRVAGGNSSAIVVLDPRVGRSVDVVRSLHALAEAGMLFGLFPALDVENVEALARKVLKQSPLRRQGDAFVLALAGNLAGERDGDGLWPLVRRQFTFDERTALDVVVFSGHSGPIDATAGPEAILCSRDDGGGHRGKGLAPCFHDGRCFRQAQLGRTEDNAVPRIAPSVIRTQVAVVAGCGSITLGRSVIAPGYGLAHQLFLGPSRGVIVTGGVTFKIPELDLMALSWITSGVPLGEVVRRLNVASRTYFGQSGGLPPLVGPFVLLGNPCMRFEPEPNDSSIGPHSLPADIQLEGNAVAVPPIAITTDSSDGAFAIGLKEGAEPLVGFFDEPRGTLHLWKGQRTPALVRLVHDDAATFQSHRVALERAARNIPFWMTYLSTYAKTAVAMERSAELFPTALGRLPTWTTWSQHAIRRMQGRKNVPSLLGRCRAMIEDEVRPLLAQWNEEFGCCLLDSAIAYRAIAVEVWQAQLTPVGAPMEYGLCPCGEAIRWGDRFRHPVFDLERVLYQCNHCGMVGEDDGSRMLSLDKVPAEHQLGSDLVLTCSLAAPENEHLYALIGGVLDYRSTRESVGGQVMKVEVPAGCTRTLNLSIPVDTQVTQGLYPAGVFASVNGVLVWERRLTELVPP